jgi:hypothetical protein
MTKLFAQIAMILSLGYYTLTLMLAWILALLGNGEVVWDAFDLPIQSTPPALWTLIIGVLFTMFALFSLGLAYWSLNGILKGGRQQDFLQLAQRLRQTAFGLFGFWLGYNMLSGLMPYLLSLSLEPPLDAAIDWDPLDIDIVFAIIAIALLAISQTLNRAWEAEEENKHFL